MPRKYKPDVKSFVLGMLSRSKNVASVVAFTGVSRTTLWRWKKLHPAVKCAGGPARRVSLVASIGPVIEEILLQRCTLTQLELRLALRERGIRCSLRTIFSAMKHFCITRKRTKRRRHSVNGTREAKEAFRLCFNSMMEDGEDVLFLDESHFSKNLKPVYGYSRAGHPCIVKEAPNRQAHTLILAMSRSGRIFYKVYSGSVTATRLQFFVDHLPPTRIVMDNHITHKMIHVDAGIVFTPVADPEANPVEMLFSKVKRHVRKINMEGHAGTVSETVDEAVKALTAEDIAGAIRHVHRHVNAHRA